MILAIGMVGLIFGVVLLFNLIGGGSEMGKVIEYDPIIIYWINK
jgi:hypothetical protein